MSEELKPEVLETSDVAQNESEAHVVEEIPGTEPGNDVTTEPAEAPAEAPVEVAVEAPAEAPAEVAVEAPVEAAPVVNFGEKTLSQLSEMFQRLVESEDRMKRSKEAEAIKSAFYKRLSKEKAEAGLGAEVDEPLDAEEVAEGDPLASARDDKEEVASTDKAVEAASADKEEAVAGEEAVSPFAAIENGFKELYNKYKKERAEFNRQIEQEKEANLAAKLSVIEDLKALVEAQEDMKDTFPKFREIQNRWREIGPVPQQNYQDVNRQYQFQVEKFYDMVQINRDLRDLDFRKNLEAKEGFCEQAEELAASEDSIGAFKELQKLHEQWKEYGPVAKEYRESIWERFRAATAVINRKYQAHFEDVKARQEENLAAKTVLCEKVEAIAEMELSSSLEWNEQSKAIEDIQQEWRGIGFATKKENQRIYDRFRAACDKFFTRKREYYNRFKEDMNGNMEKKLAIIEKAEALKDSKDWKKTTDAFIELQRQWKEIGAVPRKKSEQLWKRFRAACDAFFDEKSKHGSESNFHQNLEAKRALIAEIEAYEPQADEAANTEAMNAFSARWKEIGFVPFKEKEKINAAYNAAIKAKFPRTRGGERRGGSAPARSEKDRLVQKYNALQQEISTYENNIGFFSLSKNSESIIEMMKGKIEAAKAELEEIGAKIRACEEEGE